jgi:hypothetical protein
MQTIRADEWKECVSCRRYVLHKKTNACTAVGVYYENYKVVLDSRRPLSTIDLIRVKVLEKIFNGGV